LNLRHCICILVILVISACQNDIAEINKLYSKDQLKVEIGNDVEIIYSDSAITKVKIQTPVLYRYIDNSNPRQEFPSGIIAYFYDANQNIQSVLSGKSAIRYENKKEVVIRDSVVWESTIEGKLETNELIWDETKNIIYSNKLVQITQPGQKIVGYRFETDPNFSHWKILYPKGNLKIEDFSKNF
jgi:LPS export ABC transporter protein LptC